MKYHAPSLKARRGNWVAVLKLTLILPLLPLHVLAQNPDPIHSINELKQLSFDELLEMEVTSVSKRPEKLSEAASAIQVITGEEIRRSGATSIPEALRLASNLQVAQRNSHEWVISARGFSSDVGNKLLVLVDGRTVYTPLFSGVFWDRQDYLLEDIERIEVISGPGGTLWGANAVNGVINITTKSAKDTQGLYLEGGGGTELKGFGGMRYGGRLSSNVTYRVYGKYFDRDDAVFPNGTDAMDQWHMGQGGFRVDADPSAQDTFTLQGDFYSGEHSDAIDLTGGNILGRWSHFFSDESDMSLQVYYDRTHLKTLTLPYVINGIPLAPAGTFEDDLDTYDIDFQHRFGLGERNRLVWGLGYRFTHDSVENSPGLAFFPPTLDHHLFSAFVQDEIKLRENLFFTPGIKVEHNEYTGLELEPSARLQWNVTSDHTLWAAVSRAVRTPSRIDRDFSQPAPPNFVILQGGKDFESETVIAYELGHRAQLGKKVAASLALFFNEYDDIRSTSTNTATFVPFFFENNLEGETYGFEASISYQMFDWWRLRGGYNLLKEDLRVKSGRMDFNNALNETADPEQQFSLRSSMNFPHKIELDAALRWVDTLRVNNSGIPATVPSYFELDVRLGWRPTENLELSIVGQNLLDNQHPEFGVPGPFRVEIERSVYGKVTWRF